MSMDYWIGMQAIERQILVIIVWRSDGHSKPVWEVYFQSSKIADRGENVFLRFSLAHEKWCIKKWMKGREVLWACMDILSLERMILFQ